MYREAKDQRALRSYLVHQREGAHVVEAEAALEALAWKDACELGSADAYGSYLLHYPDGDHAAEAAARRDDAVWSSVRERDSIYGYRRYLDKHPLGAHRVEAASRLDALTFHRVRIVVRARSTWRGDGLAMATGFAEPLQDVWVEWLHGQGFARPTEVEVVDLTDVSAPPHPLEAWPVEVGTGLIVVDLDERRGMRLDPYFETVIKGTVTLYASGKERPLTSGWVEARSSAFVPRPSQDALHRDAEVRLVGQLPQSVRVRDFLEPGAEPVAQDAPAPVAPRRPVTPARAPKSKSSLADRLSK